MNKTDAFHWWLTSIPDRINELKNLLDKQVARPLDGSLPSLDTLEAYLIQTYPVRSLSRPENRALLDQLASYVGDVAEKNIPNATWTINTIDEKDVNYNFPVLKVEGNFFNPFTAITASLDRKKGNFIRQRIEALRS